MYDYRDLQDCERSELLAESQPGSHMLHLHYTQLL
jgi:hypothetical protein